MRGKLGAEVANVTDEQEAIVVNLTTGAIAPGVSSYQTPREFRVKAGISF